MSHCIHVVSSDNWPYVSRCSPCNESELAAVFTKVYILTNQNWIYIPKYPAYVLTGQTWLYPIHQVKIISVPRRIYVPSRQNVLCPIVYSIHRFKIGSLSHHVCVLTNQDWVSFVVPMFHQAKYGCRSQQAYAPPDPRSLRTSA